MSLLLVFPLTAVALLTAAPSPDVSPNAENPWVGTWHEQNDTTAELTLSLTGETIQVREVRAGRLVAEYTCKLDGKDCSFKDEGRKATVSLWKNGPKLVEMRTRGGHVTRRRFTFDDKASTLQAEDADMAPNGRTENVAYVRTP